MVDGGYLAGIILSAVLCGVCALIFYYYVYRIPRQDAYTKVSNNAKYIHYLFAKKVAAFSGTVVSFAVMITLIVLGGAADAHPD